VEPPCHAVPSSIIQAHQHLPADKQLHELYPHRLGDSDWVLGRQRRGSPGRISSLRSSAEVLHSLPRKPWKGAAVARPSVDDAATWEREATDRGRSSPRCSTSHYLRRCRYSREHPLYGKAKNDFAGLFVDDPQDFPSSLPPRCGTRRSNLVARSRVGRSARSENRARRWPAGFPRKAHARDWFVKNLSRARGLGV